MTVDPILLAELRRDEDAAHEPGTPFRAIPDPLSALARWVRAVKGRTINDMAARGLSGAPWTIAYGHTGPEVHSGLVWTEAQGDAALVADATLHCALLANVCPWTSDLDPVRRRVFQNMIFNMGWDNPKTPAHEGLSGFVHTLDAARMGRLQVAADGLKASLWYRQTGDRAKRLVAQYLTGVEQA